MPRIAQTGPSICLNATPDEGMEVADRRWLLSADPGHEGWQCFPIRGIEEQRSGVPGASLDAVQMAGSRVRGSLAFLVDRGIVLGSGLIDGKLAVRGEISDDAVMLSLGGGSAADRANGSWTSGMAISPFCGPETIWTSSTPRSDLGCRGALHRCGSGAPTGSGQRSRPVRRQILRPVRRDAARHARAECDWLSARLARST